MPNMPSTGMGGSPEKDKPEDKKKKTEESAKKQRDEANEIKESTSKQLSVSKEEVEKKKKRRRRRRPRRKKKPEMSEAAEASQKKEEKIEEVQKEKEEKIEEPKIEEPKIEEVKKEEEEPMPEPEESFEDLGKEPEEEIKIDELEHPEEEKYEYDEFPEEEPAPELEEPVEEVKEEEPQEPQKEDNEVQFPSEEEEVGPIPMGKVKEDEEVTEKEKLSPFEYTSEEEKEDEAIVTPMYPEENIETVQEKEIAEEKEGVEEAAADITTDISKQKEHEEKKAEEAIEEIKAGLDAGLPEEDRGMIKGIVTTILQFAAIIVGLVLITFAFFHFKINELILGGLQGEESVVAESEGEELSDEEMRKFGLASALLFGGNMGSQTDLVPTEIQVALYFGQLMEPQIEGETGITAATYYGELQDQKDVVNRFVDYVRTLESMQNLFQIDVYDMLEKTSKREAALEAYLADLIDLSERGKRIQDAIGVNIDDLTMSYQSLSPSKQQYESDFFTALEEMKPEKSDTLLKGFVDISQKQTALKARVSALQKLLEYYDTAIEKLDKRITAITENKEALVRGIHVVDVPGGGIDIIIREEN